MLRALGEFEIEGIRTTIPAHELVLSHPDFAAGNHSTKWVEDEVDLSRAHVRRRQPPRAPPPTATSALVERTVPVEVDGKRFR